MRDGQAAGELIDGVVVRSISGFYEVDTPVGRRTAALRSGLRRARGDTMYESRGRVRFRSEALEPVVVGDRVRVRLSAAEGGRDWIEEVLPRERVLQRRAAGKRRPVGQTLVANVDQVLLVFAVRDPEPKLGLVDRLLVAAESQDIPPVLVLNKVDLPIDEEVLGGFAELEAVGYPLVAASARTGEGLDGLRAQLAGRTSAVVGPSGVGKSSLLNAVQPGLLLGTGVVSEAIHKGRHTRATPNCCRWSSAGTWWTRRECASSGCGRWTRTSWSGTSRSSGRYWANAALQTAPMWTQRAARSCWR